MSTSMCSILGDIATVGQLPTPAQPDHIVQTKLVSHLQSDPSRLTAGREIPLNVLVQTEHLLDRQLGSYPHRMLADVGAPGFKRGALFGGEIVHLVDADNAGTTTSSVP